MTRFPLEPRQFAVEPSAWENEFADALEAIFARGTQDLGDIVAALNATRLRTPDGQAWSEHAFRATLARLGG